MCFHAPKDPEFNFCQNYTLGCPVSTLKVNLRVRDRERQTGRDIQRNREIPKETDREVTFCHTPLGKIWLQREM